MRKRLGSLALLLCFWLLTDLSAIHAQQSDVHRLSLHFDGFSIETEYLEHEVYLVEYDTPLEKGFEIKCNESSETIDRYTLSKSFDTLNTLHIESNLHHERYHHKKQLRCIYFSSMHTNFVMFTIFSMSYAINSLHMQNKGI